MKTLFINREGETPVFLVLDDFGSVVILGENEALELLGDLARAAPKIHQRRAKEKKQK